MRREVARAALTAACIGLVVLALPLAVSIYLLVHANEQGELQNAALRAATTVDPSFGIEPANPGQPVVLPQDVEREIQVGLYDTSGRLRAGVGPPTADAAVRAALVGSTGQGHSPGLLEVTVPTVEGVRVIGAIRAASPVRTVWVRTGLAWLLLAGLVAVALVAALPVARRRARRLAAPLELLAEASRAVGDGDFAVQVPDCGIEEIDRVAATQNATALRLGQLLERERQFAADASHQLRTPLAGLQLVLESATTTGARPDRIDRIDEVLDEALATTRRLMATVEDVLALHRPDTDLDPFGSTGSGTVRQSPLSAILAAAGARWAARFEAVDRRLEHRCAVEVADRRLPAVRVGQILDVLLQNALAHGAGTVQITGRPASSATAIDVTDHGTGIPADAEDTFRRGHGNGHGIGLSLARQFAVSLGGRLILAARVPPVFSLLLPNRDPAPSLPPATLTTPATKPANTPNPAP